MVKRKKRAAKGVKSVGMQIRLHEKKLTATTWAPRRKYYKKEISKFRKELAKKKRIAGAY